MVGGATKLIKGDIDPERAFVAGTLGIVVYRASDARGIINKNLPVTFIPWSQVRMIHTVL